MARAKKMVHQSKSLFAQIERLAIRIVNAGPHLSKTKAKSAVQVLKQAFTESGETVKELSGLHKAVDEVIALPLRVVSRAGWISWLARISERSFIKNFPSTNLSCDCSDCDAKQVRNPDKASERDKEVSLSLLENYYLPLSERLVLSYLVARVSKVILGGIDLEAQQVVLVAPNVVALEREFDADVMDIRSWVAMRELVKATVRRNFPWMNAYLEQRLAQLFDPELELMEKIATDSNTQTGEDGADFSDLIDEGITKKTKLNKGKELISDIRNIRMNISAKAKAGAKTITSYIGGVVGYFGLGLCDRPRLRQRNKQSEFAKLDAENLFVSPNNNVESEQNRKTNSDGTSIDFADPRVQALDEMLFLYGTIDAYVDLLVEKTGVEEFASATILHEITQVLHERRLTCLGKIAHKTIGSDASGYEAGVRFTRLMLPELGIQKFTKMWESADNLPTEEELFDPQTWIERINIH